MLKIIIGNKAYSSWSLRGWLAVKQTGLPYEEVVVPMYDADWPQRKTQADLAVSAGKVPTLWDGDIAVWDSIAIVDYLNDITGGTRFWPKDKAALALARSMAAEMHSGYVPLRKACSMNVRKVFDAQPMSDAVAENIARIDALWSEARSRFGAGGPYLFGEFGAADIMFAPVVFRIQGYQLPVSETAQAYVDAMLAHPWMVEWFEGAKAESWVLDQYEGGPIYE
ncbi:glutathione S-transferase family protein [Sphingobium sp. DEHP117]|uniref:glutathione S-transferase family protein n=1 Tax=Sphingobium sp. DEHP117 TaxID=2993436 RepID=UPI0027D6F2B6|nr:glutathione S-transferase N-terminal domain-containing protein [Sphingobium sp. DEHP117]MDQ4421198.1 glutathione S-transferase family protein [Sphingobium sp. DEHP117]